MIPNFPKFKRLELSDKAEFEALTSVFPPYSDFNFVSLFCNSVADDVQLSVLNGNLVVRFFDYITLEPFLTFIGSNKVEDTISSLIQYSEDSGLKPMLKLIPEHSLTNLADTSPITVEEDPDNHDYILKVEKLADLELGSHKTKKRYAEKFIQKYPNYELRVLDLNSAEIKDEILQLFKKWEKDNDRSHSETEQEFKAVEKLLNHADKLGVSALGIYISGQLVGFTINESVHDKFYMAHFGKYDYSYEGVSYILESETAKYFKAQGFEFMNFEQDLGLPGLRKSKRSWHPIKYLKKYKVSKSQ